MGRQHLDPAPAAHQAARPCHGRLAFDPSTGGILLYGGGNLSGPNCTSTFFRDTWIYDGRDWRDVTPSITPPAVTLPALATDPARSRVCTFVGNGNTTDVWEWDGAQWQVVPALNRAPRLLAMSAAYNARTGRISVFSYQTTTVWEWDGAQWYGVRPAGMTPPDMPNRRAAADPTGGGVAVFGGNVANPDGNVWYWDGSSWSIAGTFPSPRLWPENVGLAVGTSPGAQLVLYVATHDTWTLDLTQSPAPFRQAWTLPRPKHSGRIMSTYDAARDQLVILAGVQGVRTWVHRDGEGYVDLPGPQPPAVFPIGFHPPTGQVVGLHRDRATQMVTTWIFDGTSWSSNNIAPAPPSLFCTGQSTYSYDLTRRMLIWFDGSTREVWGWNGQAWTLLQAADPQVPLGCSLAFDAGRNRLVLFARTGSQPIQTDVWEWDGSSWSLANPSSGPLSQGVGNATYCPPLGGVVAVAGNPNSPLALWHWDGTLWTQLPGTQWRSDMGNAGGGGLHYDPSRDRILALGIFFDLRLEPYSFWQLQLPTLTADQIEPRIGETVAFTAAMPGQAFHPWLMGLSLSAWPGIPVRPSPYYGFERIPLTPDSLLAASLGAGLLGILDGQGRGSLSVSLPNNPALTGLRFHAAGITLAPGPAVGEITSRVGLRIVQ